VFVFAVVNKLTQVFVVAVVDAGVCCCCCLQVDTGVCCCYLQVDAGVCCCLQVDAGYLLVACQQLYPSGQEPLPVASATGLVRYSPCHSVAQQSSPHLFLSSTSCAKRFRGRARYCIFLVLFGAILAVTKEINHTRNKVQFVVVTHDMLGKFSILLEHFNVLHSLETLEALFTVLFCFVVFC
jgi:hypothetical protein